MKKISVIVLIFFQLFISKNIAQEYRNQFDQLVSFYNLESDCDTYRKQVHNSFIIPLNKNVRWLRENILSSSELNMFMIEYFNYFIQKYPHCAKKLSECTTFPTSKDEDFLNNASLFQNAFTIGVMRHFLISNPHFSKLPDQRKSIIDSLTNIFDSWEGNKVVVANNPIEISTGKFYTNYNEKKFTIIAREDDQQTETVLKTGEISKYKIKWLGKYEYTLKLINKSSGNYFPSEVQETHCKITEVTNKSYSGIAKSESMIITFTIYKE